MSDAMSDPNV